jgi:hypothetical protein
MWPFQLCGIDVHILCGIVGSCTGSPSCGGSWPGVCMPPPVWGARVQRSDTPHGPTRSAVPEGWWILLQPSLCQQYHGCSSSRCAAVSSTVTHTYFTSLHRAYTKAAGKVCGLTLLFQVRTLWRCCDSLFFEAPLLASDALLTTLHPLLKTALQTVEHFKISCLRAPFPWF